MRKLIPFLILVAVIALGLLVSRGPAAPALPDKPVRWEYAELQYRGFQQQLPGFPMGAQAGGRVGVAAGGPAMPGMPGQGAVAAAPPPNMIQWSTADEEIEATDWKALADKLKAPAAKGEGSATMHRLRVLNRLSADGWEIYERSGTYGGTFRRRVQ